MTSGGSSLVFQRVLAVVHILFLANSNIGSFAEIVESPSSGRAVVVRPTFSLLGPGRQHFQSLPFPEKIMSLRHSIISEARLPEGLRDEEDSARAAKTRRELLRHQSSTSLRSVRLNNVTERYDRMLQSLLFWTFQSLPEMRLLS